MDGYRKNSSVEDLVCISSLLLFKLWAKFVLREMRHDVFLTDKIHCDPGFHSKYLYGDGFVTF